MCTFLISEPPLVSAPLTAAKQVSLGPVTSQAAKKQVDASCGGMGDGAGPKKLPHTSPGPSNVAIQGVTAKAQKGVRLLLGFSNSTLFQTSHFEFFTRLASGALSRDSPPTDGDGKAVGLEKIAAIAAPRKNEVYGCLEAPLGEKRG